MTKRFTLLATAALGLAMAAGTVAGASAKTVTTVAHTGARVHAVTPKAIHHARLRHGHVVRHVAANTAGTRGLARASVVR